MEIVPALGDDEHVVDADAEAEEGQDGVQGGDWEPKSGAETETNDKSKQDGEESRQGEVEPQASPGYRAQDKGCVDSHQEVAGSHQTGVEENRGG